MAHIEVDAIHDFITPTGHVHPWGNPDAWKRQERLLTKNACSLARNFIEDRFAVIIDDVVAEREHFRRYVEGLKAAGVPVHYVRLLPRLGVCSARNDAREKPDRVRPERVTTVHRYFDEAGDIGGATIDSSDLTPYETADKLQALTTAGESIVWRPE